MSVEFPINASRLFSYNLQLQNKNNPPPKQGPSANRGSYELKLTDLWEQEIRVSLNGSPPEAAMRINHLAGCAIAFCPHGTTKNHRNYRKLSKMFLGRSLEDLAVEEPALFGTGNIRNPHQQSGLVNEEP